MGTLSIRVGGVGRAGTDRSRTGTDGLCGISLRTGGSGLRDWKHNAAGVRIEYWHGATNNYTHTNPKHRRETSASRGSRPTPIFSDSQTIFNRNNNKNTAGCMYVAVT